MMGGVDSVRWGMEEVRGGVRMTSAGLPWCGRVFRHPHIGCRPSARPDQLLSLPHFETVTYINVFHFLCECVGYPGEFT